MFLFDFIICLHSYMISGIPSNFNSNNNNKEKQKTLRLITATRNNTKNQQNNHNKKKKKKKTGKKNNCLDISCDNKRNLTREGLDMRKRTPKSESESLLISVQNNVTRTNYANAKIVKTQQNNRNW